MNAWTVFVLAFAAVLAQAYWNRGKRRYWYLEGIIPLAYGGVIAWMFLEDDLIRALQIILFGSAVPIFLLLSLRRGEKKTRRDGRAEEQ